MYDIDFGKKGELLLHVRKFLLFPKHWSPVSNRKHFDVNWHSCKFTQENRKRVPREKGVYCFVVIPDYEYLFTTKYLFYIGKTNRTLRVRYKEYLNDQAGKGKPRSKVFEMLRLYQDHLYFFYTAITDTKDVDIFEEELLNVFVPHINTKIPDARVKPELMNIYES